MQLWSSRHLQTGVVALSMFKEAHRHPARAGFLPDEVRIVEPRIAEVAEAIARDRAATAKAAGVVLRLDLDDLVQCAEAKLGADRDRR